MYKSKLQAVMNESKRNKKFRFYIISEFMDLFGCVNGVCCMDGCDNEGSRVKGRRADEHGSQQDNVEGNHNGLRQKVKLKSN